MWVVWKTEFIIGRNFLYLPKNSVPLSVHTQNDRPHIWWKVPVEEKKLEERAIHAVGTGDVIPFDNIEFIGTFLTAGDSLVFHVFEALEVNSGN